MLQTEFVPAGEVLDLLYEAAGEIRRDDGGNAIKLMTAHAAEGLGCNHVTVLECADWRWDQEDESCFLYVAMTRARQTLPLIRTEGGRNSYLMNLWAVEGVQDQLPTVRPQHRTELERRYVMLEPASMDLGFSDRKPPAHPIHRVIAALQARIRLRSKDDSFTHTQDWSLVVWPRAWARLSFKGSPPVNAG